MFLLSYTNKSLELNFKLTIINRFLSDNFPFIFNIRPNISRCRI